MTKWRYLEDDGVTASAGLATDEILATRVGLNQSIPTLRLYTYKSNCALVGRFQSIENELNLKYCAKHDIPVNRRPTGGGAIIMGAEQLGVALIVPGKADVTYARVREQMGIFSKGIILGLLSIGIKAEFRRKNDLEVAGKKIAGLGLHKTSSGGLLFHASLLVDLDVPFMLKVLNTPFEKISDKEISTVGERTTTLNKETNQRLVMKDVRSIILRGYMEAFNVDIKTGTYSKEELDDIKQLEKDKYKDHNWIFQTTYVPDTTGKAIIKTSGGLLDVRIILAGKMIKSIYIRGDFFTSENAIADLEQSLRWHPSQGKGVYDTLLKVYLRWSEDLNSLPIESLFKVIELATKRAAVFARKASSDPYGCFINPGSVHA